MDKLTNPVLYGVPLFLILIITEIYVSYKEEKDLYDWKDLCASSFMGAGALLVGPLSKLATFGLFYFLYNVAEPLRAEWLGFESLGWSWWVWILAIIADDFNFYWYHRYSHTIRVLWAAHVVHHSSRRFNYGTAIRNGWITLLYKPFWWLWMPLVGFHPVMIATVISINSLYQFCLHTQYVPRLGFLEKFMNTPILHQVHHARNVEYLDKNHGGMLIIWDKLFGTFKDLDDNVKPEFGVLSEPNSYNPMRILLHEYDSIWSDIKKAPGWKNKLKYVFSEPGWSHDNSRLTAKQMQEKMGFEKKPIKLNRKKFSKEKVA
jgi:sterol desaturase/sphingolipid hydroxylase (fatty acid hydroxylase superfamily)